LTTVPVVVVKTQGDKETRRQGDLQPAPLLGQAVSGLTRGINWVVGQTAEVMNEAGRIMRPVKPGTPPVYLNATVSLTDVDLADLMKRLGVTVPFEVAGRLSFNVKVGIPINSARDARAYRLDGTVNLSRLDVAGMVMTNVRAGLNYRNGVAQLDKLSGEIGKGTFVGSAKGQVVPLGKLSVDLELRDLPTAEVVRPVPMLAGKASGTLTLTVRAGVQVERLRDPAAWNATGKLNSTALRLAGVRLDRLSLAWALADATVNLSDLKAALYRGEVTGTASVPLTGRAAGRTDLKITDVDLLALASSVGGLPFRIEGRVSGTAQGSYVPPKEEGKGKKEKGGAWSAELNVSAAALKVQNVPVEKLHGKFEYRDGKGEYHLEGEALGGKLNIDGKIPDTTTGSADRIDGRLRVEGVRLSRLWPVLRLRRRLGGLTGVVTVDLPYRHEGKLRIPVGVGRFDIRDLRYRGNELAPGLRGDIRLTTEGASLRNVSAEIAGGTLRGGLVYRHGARSGGSFALSLSRVETTQLLVFDQVKDTLKGPIDLHLRGSLGKVWRGSGSMEMASGKVWGVEVSEWRVPLEFNFAPGVGRGELTVRESSAQVGHGRARLTTTFHWNDYMRLEGSLQFFDAGLRSLAGLLGDVTTYAQGRVTGRLEFGGGEVHSVNDLTGNLQATLREAQALQLPILSLAVPYLMPGQGSTTFRSGDVRARLANGVWRIAQMTLESDVAHLIIQGTITVAGRLDLEVTGRTTSLGGIDPLLLRLLARTLPPVGPVPVGLIFRVTELLSNRVVHLHIRGTTKEPQVEVEALRILSEEAVRFFLTRALVQ
jgi:hypothetical protein